MPVCLLTVSQDAQIRKKAPVFFLNDCAGPPRLQPFRAVTPGRAVHQIRPVSHTAAGIVTREKSVEMITVSTA